MEFLVDWDSLGSSPGPGLHWSQLPKGYNSLAFSSLPPTFSCLSSLSIGAEPSQRFDYVEGFVMVDDGLINNWRSSFFSPMHPVKISSIGASGGVLYCLEMAKNYDDSAADSIDEVGLHFNLTQQGHRPQHRPQ
ncbi:hypothetical protein C4D60_Mb04t19020 [Musa balbisiana]|uniref:Cytokinin dehydrogenase 1 FAD/cytokinin binding domain-containing protein n=1 Tax=Musa balbisiana TaxID=52838 RepID=A0A4S8KD80_MUSBA|nr:hypothetical protein C4D60_Mb04t19020 [Musa balbisiana]